MSVFSSACFLLMLLGFSAGCSQRTTNTWEQIGPKEQEAQGGTPSVMPNGVDGGVMIGKGSYFMPPRMVSSPARGRLAVLQLEVRTPYAPLLQLR